MDTARNLQSVVIAHCAQKNIKQVSLTTWDILIHGPHVHGTLLYGDDKGIAEGPGKVILAFSNLCHWHNMIET